MPQAWIAREVLEGIENLYSLRLSFSPPAEMILKTAERWTEVVGDGLGLAVEKVDVPRLREAFKRLERECSQWPPPKMLLDYLPPRPARKVLMEPPLSQAEREEGRRKLRAILESI